MFKFFKIELKKYASPIVLGILIFYLCNIIFVSQLRFRADYLDSQRFFEILNEHFSTFIISVVPITIIIFLSSEFSKGYAGKLISNGLSRFQYIIRKINFVFHLSFLVTVLYLVLFFMLLLIFPVTTFASTLVKYVFCVFFITFMSASISSFFTLVFRRLILSFILFYLYFSIDFIMYEEKKWIFPLAYMRSFITDKGSLTNADIVKVGLFTTITSLLLWMISTMRFKKISL